MNSNDIGNLRPAKTANGKQMSGLLIRMPQSKSNSKFPAKLAAAFTSTRVRVRGLWWRIPHGPFVAQITDRTPEGIVRSTKATLKAGSSLAEAKKEHQRLILNSADGKLAVMGRAPKFASYAASYMQAIKAECKKALPTIKAECCRIEWWRDYLGDTPLNKLSLPIIRKGLIMLATLYLPPRLLKD